jgi:drug/metabolite transporter (DMT)-like permease
MDMLFLLQSLPDVNLSIADAIAALTPIVVPFAVYGVKLLSDRIPKQILPVVAVGIGIGITYLESFISGGDWSIIAGAGLGALGIVVRAIYKLFTDPS